MPVFASDIAAMHTGAGGHATDPNGLISEVLTPCRLGRRSLQQSCNARVGPTAMSVIHSYCFTQAKQSR
jgi:hypothetical protein